jgi:hypothetical protein
MWAGSKFQTLPVFVGILAYSIKLLLGVWSPTLPELKNGVVDGLPVTQA